jgi:hypothetical protein
MMLDAHSRLAIPSETHFVPEVIEAFDGGAPSAEQVVRQLSEHRR